MQLKYITALLSAALPLNPARADDSVADDLDIYVIRYDDRHCEVPSGGPGRFLIPGDTCHTFDEPFESFYYEWAPRADSDDGVRHEKLALSRLNCTLDLWAGRWCASEHMARQRRVRALSFGAVASRVGLASGVLTREQVNEVNTDCIYVPWDLPPILSLAVECEELETESEYGM